MRPTGARARVGRRAKFISLAALSNSPDSFMGPAFYGSSPSSRSDVHGVRHSRVHGVRKTVVNNSSEPSSARLKASEKSSLQRFRETVVHGVCFSMCKFCHGVCCFADWSVQVDCSLRAARVPAPAHRILSWVRPSMGSSPRTRCSPSLNQSRSASTTSWSLSSTSSRLTS